MTEIRQLKEEIKSLKSQLDNASRCAANMKKELADLAAFKKEALEVILCSSQLSPKDAQGNLRKKSGEVRERAREFLAKLQVKV